MLRSHMFCPYWAVLLIVLISNIILPSVVHTCLICLLTILHCCVLWHSLTILHCCGIPSLPYTISQSHNPIVGCNPTIGCVSNSWMQKHPIDGCSYIPMPTVAIRGHLKVAPYCESILHENTFQMTP